MRARFWRRGSIGSELCQEIVIQKASQTISFNSSEFGLYKIYEVNWLCSIVKN